MQTGESSSISQKIKLETVLVVKQEDGGCYCAGMERPNERGVWCGRVARRGEAR